MTVQTPTVRRALVGSSTPLLATALASLLAVHDFETHVTGDGASARAALAETPIEVAVLDFDAGVTGLQLLRELRSDGLPTRVVLIVGDLDSAAPSEAVELGVDGLLPRNAATDTAAQCIAGVAAGGQWLDPRAMKAAYDRVKASSAHGRLLLTRREQDVARLVATGQRNRGIATALGISEGTVKMHLHNVYAKLGLESRTQLAMDTRLRALG